MADETQDATEEQRTFTQDEVNRLMGEVRRETRAKFADYDELREKATKYDEATEAAKSELQLAVERAEKAEAEAKSLKEAKAHADMIARVSRETGVPADLISGADEAQATAAAQAIAAYAKASSTVAPADKGGAAKSKLVTKSDIDSIKDPVRRVRARAEHIELWRQ